MSENVDNKSKKISLVVPMYFEEEVASECYNRLTRVLTSLKGYDYEIIFVNDGSKDKTLEILTNMAEKDNKIKVISFSRNFGHQCAVTAGLKYVSGDVVCIIDADMQDPPEVICDMLKLWEEGNEVIYARRKKRDGESIFKLLTAKAFYKVLKTLSDTDIPQNTGDFRLVDRKVVDTINELPEHNKFLRGLFSWVGYKQIPFEYHREERFAGETKYPLKKMLKLAADGIIGFSSKPLKIVGLLGIISVVISLAIFIYSILSFILGESHLVVGWTSLIMVITFFGGVQLLSLWIIAEYIGRIYDESKKRPEYIIDKTINL